MPDDESGGLWSADDLQRNEEFVSAVENRIDVSELLRRHGVASLSRRQLIRRHFRQRLSIRPQWKPCVPITCPPVEDHWISESWRHFDEIGEQ